MPELRPYQRSAIREMDAAGGRAIFAYPPGTGKTATVCSWLAEREFGRTGRGLIVAPNGPVLPHWVSEAARFTELIGVVGTGGPRKRTATRNAVGDGGIELLVVNYETMRNDIDALLAIGWDAVVFDESHRLKNRKALTFKAA